MGREDCSAAHTRISQEENLVNPGLDWTPVRLSFVRHIRSRNVPPHGRFVNSSILGCFNKTKAFQNRFRKHIFVPIIASLAYATYTNQFSNTVAGRALAGIHWTVFLGTIEKLLFGNPEKDYWRLDRPRAYQVLKYVQYYVASDLLHEYFVKYHYLEGVNIAFLDLRADTWTRSFCNAFCVGAKLYFPIQMNYALASVISVLFGICSPKDWPPLFGRIQDVTTVRDFWGSFWHQLIRKVFASYGAALVRFTSGLFLGYGGAIIALLGLPPQNTIISYFKLYSSFAISGATHGLMTWAMPANPDHTFNDRFLTVFTCFVGNAVAMNFEDIVMGIYHKRGGTREKRLWKSVLGYTWVTCWIWITCCWGATSYIKMGMTGVSDVPLPIAGKLLSRLQASATRLSTQTLCCKASLRYPELTSLQRLKNGSSKLRNYTKKGGLLWAIRKKKVQIWVKRYSYKNSTYLEVSSYAVAQEIMASGTKLFCERKQK
ncbi:membrane bound O-acyl transferase family-domain-containing protein [Amylocarpus encephaloides]|uniref:Membrane bound O-acyl transferase family-domain-containing protein n=1 Tax=Amylocarpus encephaloides TaxID=45428 RepID=A0A9P8C2F8_9HELO|nr:membrane bound O-acyl transferase family-domain-containing protein [Amylocarpus encephaloides]